MAEAVANALNKGFEMQEKKKEKKTDPPMEIVPLNPAKWPKIQTEAFATPKGKGQPKSGEASEGSKGPLTKSRFDLGIPKDILKSAPSQADGVYSTLVERMAEDRDWADGLWNIRDRLVLVIVYGAKDLGRSEGKVPPRNHILDTYKRVTRKECPDWDLQDGEHLPILEEVAMPIPGRSGCLNKSWALMMLPEGLLSELSCTLKTTIAAEGETTWCCSRNSLWNSLGSKPTKSLVSSQQ